jgi:nucleoside-diphosphate-sugar epimerase
MHAIIGNGPVGAATARLLSSRGEPVTVITRTGGESTDEVRHVAADATDVDSLTGACAGATVIYSCASPPYHRWDTDFPALASAILSAAERSGAVLVTASNLYGYGPTEGALTEQLPLNATGPKGRTRADIWKRAHAAHAAGRVRVTEARASDFFGPGVTVSAQLGSRVIPRVLDGKSVKVLGNPEVPHSWTYIDDFAQSLITLGGDERAWGRPWHVPSSEPRSQHQMIDLIARHAGLPPVAVKGMPWPMLRALSLVVAPLRGLDEIRYQFDESFVMDSSAFTATFGAVATAVDDALASTVEWWRQKGGGD